MYPKIIECWYHIIMSTIKDDYILHQIVQSAKYFVDTGISRKDESRRSEIALHFKQTTCVAAHSYDNDRFHWSDQEHRFSNWLGKYLSCSRMRESAIHDVNWPVTWVTTAVFCLLLHCLGSRSVNYKLRFLNFQIFWVQ